MLNDLMVALTSRRTLESAAIVILGLYLHFNKVAITETNSSLSSVSAPNAASGLLVFSVLCILTKMRPLWPCRLRPSRRVMSFLLDLAFILYIGDFIACEIWVASGRLSTYMGQFAPVKTCIELLPSGIAEILCSMHDQGYIIAALIFLLMIDVTATLQFLRRTLIREEVVYGTYELKREEFYVN